MPIHIIPLKPNRLLLRIISLRCKYERKLPPFYALNKAAVHISYRKGHQCPERQNESGTRSFEQSVVHNQSITQAMI